MQFDFFIKVNDVQLKVRTNSSNLADQPVLVFLHDSLGCIELWRDFPQKLSTLTGLPYMIYDRQGYGKSSPFSGEKRKNDYLEKEARVLPEVLKQCAVNYAILIGHSDGGSIALVAAAEHPDLISAVISEGAHVFVEDKTLVGIIAAKQQYLITNLKDRLAKYHGDKTEAVFDAWTETWLLPEFRTWNIEHYLPKVECPVLAIQGSEDEYGTVDQLKSIVSQVSGKAEMHLIPGAAHTPHKEASEPVLKLCADFILENVK